MNGTCIIITNHNFKGRKLCVIFYLSEYKGKRHPMKKAIAARHKCCWRINKKSRSNRKLYVWSKNHSNNNLTRFFQLSRQSVFAFLGNCNWIFPSQFLFLFLSQSFFSYNFIKWIVPMHSTRHSTTHCTPRAHRNSSASKKCYIIKLMNDNYMHSPQSVYHHRFYCTINNIYMSDVRARKSIYLCNWHLCVHVCSCFSSFV